MYKCPSPTKCSVMKAAVHVHVRGKDNRDDDDDDDDDEEDIDAIVEECKKRMSKKFQSR